MISRDEEIINLYLDALKIEDISARFSIDWGEVIYKLIKYRTQRVMNITTNFEYNENNITIINNFAYDSIIKVNSIDDTLYRKKIRNIVKLTEDGLTLSIIAKIFSISRERVRQVVNSYAPELHLAKEQKKFKKCEVCGEIKKQVYKKSGYSAICKKCFSKVLKTKKKKWSRDFDKCISCGTTSSPHHVKGRCRKCHAQFIYHYDLKRKESLKKINKTWRLNNPEKIKAINSRSSAKARDRALDGNRNLALERDKFRCTKCGITEKESQKKYKRKLYVSHINKSNDNSLGNLITLCSGCHNGIYSRGKKSKN